MKILVIANFTAPRCGIQNYAVQFSTALRRAGADVTDWDATYDQIVKRREAGASAYLPDNARDYDVVHLNWHPVALNTYVMQHWAYVKGHTVCSVFLHDLPPWSGCPCEDAMDVIISAEPYGPSKLVLPYPIPDWVTDLPAPDKAFTVGVSGVRGDGFAEVASVCEAHGWALNKSGETWLSIEDEIRRLARSSVNVCWYHEGRGLSGAGSFALGSRRPLLINGSPMLRHLVGLPSVCYRPHTTLEDALLEWTALEWAVGRRTPQMSIPPDKSWSHAAEQLLETWEDTRG